MWWPLATVEAIIRCIISERLFLLHPNDSLVVGLLLYHNVSVRHYFPPSVNVCCLHFVITFPIDWYPLIKCISIRRLRPGCGQGWRGPGRRYLATPARLLTPHQIFTTADTGHCPPDQNNRRQIEQAAGCRCMAVKWADITCVLCIVPGPNLAWYEPQPPKYSSHIAAVPPTLPHSHVARHIIMPRSVAADNWGTIVYLSHDTTVGYRLAAIQPFFSSLMVMTWTRQETVST